MKKNKNTRQILDDVHYKILAISKDQKFKDLEQSMIKYYEQLGCPMPEDYFKDLSEYRAWEGSLLYLIQENPYGIITIDEYIADILNMFSINESYKKYNELRFGLWTQVLFNRQSPPSLKKFINPKILTRDGEDAVWIRIYPWTKPTDIAEAWNNSIVPLQRKIEQYRGKEKDWETFERDLKIYKIFLKTKNDLSKGTKESIEDKSKSAYSQINYHPEFIEILKEYPKIDENLHKIISRCEKNLSELKLL